MISDFELASYIDHTLLKPEASEEDVEQLCQEALEYGFKTVCLYPKYIPLATKLLKDSKTVPIAVVDFPLGQGSLSKKAKETEEAIEKGAQEIDMVINYKALKEKDYREVFLGIQAVVDASHLKVVKVILETCLLDHDEKVIGCALSKAAGAEFVKTSTGFAAGGATVEDIILMRKIVGDEMGVKASGGIRTADDARKMIKAGASRIGASSSVKIVTGGKGQEGY